MSPPGSIPIAMKIQGDGYYLKGRIGGNSSALDMSLEKCKNTIGASCKDSIFDEIEKGFSDKKYENLVEKIKEEVSQKVKKKKKEFSRNRYRVL